MNPDNKQWSVNLYHQEEADLLVPYRSWVQLAKIAFLSMTRFVGRDEGEGLWHARNQSDKHMLPHHIMVRNARQADRQKRTNFADCLLIWHIGRKHSISISERLFFLAATLDRKEARWFLRHLRGEQQSFSRSDSYVGVRWSLSPAASNTHNDFFYFTKSLLLGTMLKFW